jgi:predicted Fe-Mo cluster-binding NifX family protein
MTMRIALPITNGELAAHFGHCDQFALIDVDPGTKTITGQSSVDAPPHSPGLLPGWLAQQGVNLVLAGGMGSRAIALFSQCGISVAVGISGGRPDELVTDYLAGRLPTGVNSCDH